MYVVLRESVRACAVYCSAEMAEKRANPSDTAAAGGSASTSAEAAPASLSGRSSPDQDEPVTKDDITTERESTWAISQMTRVRCSRRDRDAVP